MLWELSVAGGGRGDMVPTLCEKFIITTSFFRPIRHPAILFWSGGVGVGVGVGVVVVEVVVVVGGGG